MRWQARSPRTPRQRSPPDAVQDFATRPRVIPYRVIRAWRETCSGPQDAASLRSLAHSHRFQNCASGFDLAASRQHNFCPPIFLHACIFGLAKPRSPACSTRRGASFQFGAERKRNNSGKRLAISPPENIRLIRMWGVLMFMWYNILWSVGELEVIISKSNRKPPVEVVGYVNRQCWVVDTILGTEGFRWFSVINDNQSGDEEIPWSGESVLHDPPF